MKKATLRADIPDKKTAIQSIDSVLSAVSGDVDTDSLYQLFSHQHDIIEKKSSVIEEQKQRIAILEEYLRLERARRFGSSSEKSSNQSELFDEAEALEEISAVATALDELQGQTETKKKAGRKGLSKQLPRHQVHINLSDEEKVGAIDTFYTVAKEELDIVPAKARVIEYLQEKAVFADKDKDKGERHVKSATLPKHPLNKCIASISLLAYVIVSKYCDGFTPIRSGDHHQTPRW